MTSKELLLTLQIYNDRFIQKGEKFIDTKQMYETIGKDLEVLEMLKTYFKVNGFDELVPNDYWYDLPFEDRNKIYEEFDDDR